MRIASWRQVHPDTIVSPNRNHGIRNFQHETGAVLDRTPVNIHPMIGLVLEKLIEQIAVCPMNFNAVKTGQLRVLRALAVCRDYAWNLFQPQRSRRDERFQRADQTDMPRGRDGARGHRQRAIQENRVRDSSHMPELHQNPPARPVNRFGNKLPAFDLLG